MKIKKYQAPNMHEAMRKIKSDLGTDAVILEAKEANSRRYGVLPGGRVWEVVAAVDADIEEPVHQSKPTSLAPALPRDDVSQSSTAEPISLVPQASNPGPGGTMTENPLQTITSTLAEIQWEVRKLSRQSQFTRIASFAPSLRSLYLQLREQEIDEEMACDVVAAIGEELSPQALTNYGVVASCAAKHLQNLAPCVGSIQLKQGSTHTVFIFGPTGVGKTTTIAKLAAHFALANKKKVLLATIDTFRIAALPQLNSYAEIMGLEMEVAYTPTELRALVKNNQDKDLILIDTPGSSQRNDGQMAELKAFVDSIKDKTACLALSAATRSREMADIVERFGILGIENLIITKMDEALVFGPILNVLRRFDKPLSYLTIGQKVPEDIEAASAAKIADLLLGRVAAYADRSSLDTAKPG